MLLSALLPAALPMIGRYWALSRDGDIPALEIFSRHYSYRPRADGRKPVLFLGPGEKIVLLTPLGDALFCWRRFIDDSGQRGINCSVFRNEGAILSSLLILDAEQIAWNRWPGERLYTYVNSRKIKSPNPGACFKFAGWTPCGITKENRLIVLQKLATGTT